MVEHLSSMLETLGWIPSTANKHKEITEMKVKVLEMLELCYGDLICVGYSSISIYLYSDIGQ